MKQHSIILRALLCVILAFFTTDYQLTAQPDIGWVKVFGGDGPDDGQKVFANTDGSLTVFGQTYSSSLPPGTTPQGNLDVFQKNFQADGTPAAVVAVVGGSNEDKVHTGTRLPNGNFLMSGYTASNDGLVSGNKGSNDAYLFEMSPQALLLSSHCIGGSYADDAKSFVMNTDGTVTFVGTSASADGDVGPGNQGVTDIWICRYDLAAGTVVWSVVYGGADVDYVHDIIATADGGYLVAASTYSSDGDIGVTSRGYEDFWILRLNSSGSVVWKNTYGGNGQDRPIRIFETSDGGAMVFGVSSSNDDQVTNPHGALDIWVAKISNTGSFMWGKTFGGTSAEWLFDVIKTPDDGYVLGGRTQSSDGDITVNKGIFDAWVIRVDANADMVWQRTIGGTDLEEVHGLTTDNAGNIFVTGLTASADGDFNTPIDGLQDMFLVKFNGPVNAVYDVDDAISIDVFPNPASDVLNIHTGTALQNVTVDITDITGRTVLHTTGISLSKQMTLPIGELASGSYMLTIRGTDVILHKYFIKSAQ